jgi:hypothetical protein
MKLQGFCELSETLRNLQARSHTGLDRVVFFGTITRVEDEIRRLLDIAAWQHNPIRFLSKFLDVKSVPRCHSPIETA